MKRTLPPRRCGPDLARTLRDKHIEALVHVQFRDVLHRQVGHGGGGGGRADALLAKQVPSCHALAAVAAAAGSSSSRVR